jgi:diaminopimelate epimerase
VIYRFTKHEGLGNDFLVLLDPDGALGVSPELVRQACDRRRGIGADGLIHARRPQDRLVPEVGGAVDAVMGLHNADGSRAEMSGNGIRCLAQALLQDGWATGAEVIISTDAGSRTVTLVDGPDRLDIEEASQPGPPNAEQQFSVDMGVIKIEDAADWALGAAVRAVWADAGNPHLVLEQSGLESVEHVDLEVHGEKVNASLPGGANVHLVGPGPEANGITMRTYERGVGLTEACGTGATVAAGAALHWGLVEAGDSGVVQVNMPGGAASVIDGDGGTTSMVLIGPARFIARIDFPWL